LTRRRAGGRVASNRGKRSRSLKPGLALAPLALACLLCSPAAALAQPPNDAFENAQVLEGLPVTATGTNRDATREDGEPEHHTGRGQSVWYRWTAPTGVNVTIDTCQSDFDTVLAVYTGDSVSTLTEVATNDDACGLDDTQSRVRFNAVAGTTYQIAVDGLGAAGAITLTVSPPPVPRPGRYTGTADFDERLSFLLSPDGTGIFRFTIAGLELDCPRGTLNIRRLLLPPFPVRPDGSFKAKIVSRGRGITQVVRIEGRFIPPARARVTARVTFSHRAIGKCRYFFGALRWTVRNRG
jgi:hypothetical protein